MMIACSSVTYSIYVFYMSAGVEIFISINNDCVGITTHMSVSSHFLYSGIVLYSGILYTYILEYLAYPYSHFSTRDCRCASPPLRSVLESDILWAIHHEGYTIYTITINKCVIHLFI